MSKRTVGAVVVAITAILYLILATGKRGAPTASAASEASPVSEEGVTAPTTVAAPVKPAITAAAPAANAAQPGAPAAEATLSADERETLVMYDEMQTAFEQYRSDCLRMGEAVAIAVQAHTPAILRLRDVRDTLSLEAQTAAMQRIEAAQGPHLAKLREGMEQAVARCKHDPMLRNALRDLAKLNAPRGAQPTQ